jgi:hypothetical protein
VAKTTRKTFRIHLEVLFLVSFVNLLQGWPLCFLIQATANQSYLSFFLLWSLSASLLLVLLVLLRRLFDFCFLVWLFLCKSAVDMRGLSKDFLGSFGC